jgi:hypothetical protein
VSNRVLLPSIPFDSSLSPSQEILLESIRREHERDKHCARLVAPAGRDL